MLDKVNTKEGKDRLPGDIRKRYQYVDCFDYDLSDGRRVSIPAILDFGPSYDDPEVCASAEWVYVIDSENHQVVCFDAVEIFRSRFYVEEEFDDLDMALAYLRKKCSRMAA
jgi:hypothetical protein